MPRKTNRLLLDTQLGRRIRRAGILPTDQSIHALPNAVKQHTNMRERNFKFLSDAADAGVSEFCQARFYQRKLTLLDCVEIPSALITPTPKRFASRSARFSLVV
jgi:hypothetical protein